MFRERTQPKNPGFWITASELPTTPANTFYRRLDDALKKGGFEERVRKLAQPYYETDSSNGGKPGIDPVVYLKMMLVGFFENVPSDRALAARCADSLSIREFLRYGLTEQVPHHSSLSVIRQRLPLSWHEKTFHITLDFLGKAKLLRGKRLLIDTSVIEANASLQSLEHRLTGEQYRDYVKKLAQESGVDVNDDRAVNNFDRKRPGRKTSNKEWVNPKDPDAKVGRDKKGATRMLYKPEHVVDGDTGAILSADVKPGDEADSVGVADRILEVNDRVNAALGNPVDTQTVKIVAGDMGYHDLSELGQLQSMDVRTAVNDPKRNRKQEKLTHEEQLTLVRAKQAASSASGKAALRRRGELLERSFAHVLDCGGERHTSLRGRENILKRYLMKVTGFNISLALRKATGVGTLRQAWAATKGMVEALA